MKEFPKRRIDVYKRQVEGYKVDTTGAWLKNGVVQVKAVGEAGVYTNGKSESSSGTIDVMGSDLDLGTAVSDQENQKPSVEKKSSGSKKASAKAVSYTHLSAWKACLSFLFL